MVHKGYFVFENLVCKLLDINSLLSLHVAVEDGRSHYVSFAVMVHIIFFQLTFLF